MITGGAGFIGSHLVEELSKASEVLVIDDLSNGKMENLSGQDVKFVKGSITDLGLLRTSFEDADCVFHLAAVSSVWKSIEDPLGTARINHDGTLNVLMAAREAGVNKVVFSSSAAVYGDAPGAKLEDFRPEPKSPYGVAKLAGEHYCQVFNELYGMKNISLRYFNVFGPKQESSEYATVIPKFIKAVLIGSRPQIFGDGEQIRDFIFVKDVVRANLLAWQHDSTGSYNIASGRCYSINELLKKICEILGEEIEPIYAPPRLGDSMGWMVDISKASKIGFKPEFDLDRGLRCTIEWFQKVSCST